MNKQNHNEFVEINKLDSSIVLDIRYATTNNFTGKQVYPQAKCFMRRGTAEKIIAVQKELKGHGLGLKIFDCYRPLSVQKIFFDFLPDERYVANPYKEGFEGSNHNRGCAVDCTLIELKSGKELKMPSEFDEFNEKAHCDYTKMDNDVAKNCKLLATVMENNGFKTMYYEWWHFDDVDWKNYPLLNKPFSKIEQP